MPHSIATSFRESLTAHEWFLDRMSMFLFLSGLSASRGNWAVWHIFQHERQGAAADPPLFLSFSFQVQEHLSEVQGLRVKD